MDEAYRSQSEFNMAFSYLNRLNTLFYVCDEAAMALDSHGWFHGLMALFRELSTEMKPQEIGFVKGEILRINDMLSKHSKIPGRNPTGIMPEVYTGLQDLELFLRKILSDSGLQNRKVEDPGSSLR